MEDGEPTLGSKFCCAAKQYYSQQSNLVDTLEIIPRVIICKKPLRVDDCYEQRLIVKNNGVYPRALKYYTDSDEDTQIKVFGIPRHQYIPPGMTVHIDINIRPRKKNLINRRRHIYLEAEHPNITFEVPIIVIIKDDNQPSVPELILFPRVLPKNHTYYEFAIYNPTQEPASVVFRNVNPLLTLKAEGPKIKKRDFIRILLTLRQKNTETIENIIKIRFNTMHVTITYCHCPREFSLFWSTTQINFEETKPNREVSKVFTICNNSANSVKFEFTFENQTEPEIFPRPSRGDYDPGWDVDFSSSSSENTLDNARSSQLTKSITNYNIDSDDKRHFSIEPQTGEFLPNSATKITVTFRPKIENLNFNEKQSPPFPLSTVIMLGYAETETSERNLSVNALVSGVEAFVSPKAIDFREVYLGEEHCELIRVTNADSVVEANVYYYDFTGDAMCQILLTPEEGITLKPEQSGSFNFSFYTTIIGKIFFKFRLKIRNGGFLTVLVKASSAPVRVKPFPDLVEFGSVPFAVPQKRSVLLINPLSVPLSLQCFVSEDGEETPLVLNVDNVDELPPVHVRNPIESILAFHHEDLISAYHASDLGEIINSAASSAITIHSNTDSDDMTVCSENFTDQVLDTINELAGRVINAVKTKRIAEKNEPEIKVIQQATNELLTLPYFEDLTKFKNYACMDWNAIPSDPKEIYHDTEVIHLKPNSGRSLTVLIIPNTEGYFNRAINIRCCPHVCDNDMDFRADATDVVVSSESMITKLFVEYNCRVPDIRWNNEIVLDSEKIYAMQTYDFDMNFSNDSNIGGFLHFVVVPHCQQGFMNFRNNIWKFYIKAMESVTALCAVEFRRLGNMTLTGMLRVVGNPIGMPYHISAFVHPTRVSVFPKEIYKRQLVLEKTVVYVFVHNLTPTKTAARFYLHHEHYQRIDPHGCQLREGQGMYIAIYTMYPDPEVYKNILYVDLWHGTVIEVPLTFNVVDMPVFFEPNIRKNCDLGVILLSSESDYFQRITNFSTFIRCWNLGERDYSISFQKLRNVSTRDHCTADVTKAQIILDTKTVYLQSGEEEFIRVTAVACQEVTISSEYLVVITDLTNPKRFMNIRFTLTATFANAETAWSRHIVMMKYKRTHPFKEFPQLELVNLINKTGTKLTDVHLKVGGPFKIKDLFEKPFTKDLHLELLANEEKEITIMLNKREFEHLTTSTIKGGVWCVANNKQQKWLPVVVCINAPDIVIVENELVLFVSYVEGVREVILENIGSLDAPYKWKKESEYVEYIAEHDDYWAFSRDILSDILRMLELHEDESEDDSICQRNMTLCYQKYRCKLKRLDDSIGIAKIIEEIIENLDYEHKRYKIELSESLEDLNEDVMEPSSRTNVKQTIDKILRSLKLEDSYDVSDPSEEECNKEHAVYFYEKSGVVLKESGSKCLLHLPAVRKGYALKASFILDVVGGQPQSFSICLVNLDRAVELYPNNVYLGVKPWYEGFQTKIRIKNITQYQLSLSIIDCPREKVKNRHHYQLVEGYVCLATSRFLNLNEFQISAIKAEGIMGFCDEFIRDFSVDINGCDTVGFRFRGQGVMPILLGTDTNLPRTEQTPEEIIEEYEFLQKIYYFNMFKDITMVDKELDGAGMEEAFKTKPIKSKDFDFSDISLLSFSEESEESDTSMEERIERNWKLLLSSYVVVYNNASLPQGTILEQLINMLKFKKSLDENPCTRDMLRKVYRDYLKMVCTYDERMPINLKYFVVQPLPFKQVGYVVEMPNLKLNQFRKYQIDLQFLGPGKLIASGRTEINIPNLFVHFEVRKSDGQEFIFYRAEGKTPDFFQKKYRNMWERQIDREADPKLHPAHSFDCELRCKLHKREINKMTASGRKDLYNYYNSLNKSVYLENKHHYTNCTIFTRCLENFSGTLLRVHFLIKPSSQYYSEGQVFEDFVFIDLHMGPTLPILLRGLIK